MYICKEKPVIPIEKMITLRYVSPVSVVPLIIISLIILLSVPVWAQDTAAGHPVKTVDGTKFYEYTVKPAEGFYRVRVTFNITEEELLRYNPHARGGLIAGMKLLIPIREDVREKSRKETESTYREHIVERKQTVFRIRKMYSVSEEELLALNPHIKGRSLREGDILKIPVKKNESPEKEAEKKATTVEPKNGNKKEKTIDLDVLNKINNPATIEKQHYKIAFLLPFMLDQRNESADSRFVEFYAGALLAINKEKEKGKQLDVYTFDTEKSDVKLMEILNDTIFRQVDLIVGPAYSNQVPLVCDFSRVHRKKTLIPFTSRIYDLESNEYIYQFNPGQETELAKLTEILMRDAGTQNLIFVENPYVAQNDESNQLVAQLKVLLRNNKTDFSTVLLDPSHPEQLKASLHAKKENIFLFNTNRINVLSGQLRQLIQLSDSFNIKIYEPYSWRSSKSDKPASFYLSVFRSEYSENEYEEYMTRFSEVFNWLPATENPRFDLLGYDLMQYYFITSEMPSGAKYLQYPLYEGIQSTIQFEKTSTNGGYINKQLIHFE